MSSDGYRESLGGLPDTEAATTDPPRASRHVEETYSPEWGYSRRRRYVALFRLAGFLAILQHIRWVALRQRGPSRSGLNPQPELADVPDRELETLRDRGYRVTEERI